MTDTVTALIVDDEPLARKKIRDLLAAVPWIECVGEVGDGLTAVAAIDEQQPDLVFLDIHMPRLSGLDILHRAKHTPAVIFTTAYDRYTVTAFELAAVDYLLKPFGRERLLTSLERVRALLGREDRGQSAVRSREAFTAGPARRLFVREAGRVIPVRATDIVRWKRRTISSTSTRPPSATGWACRFSRSPNDWNRRSSCASIARTS